MLCLEVLGLAETTDPSPFPPTALSFPASALIETTFCFVLVYPEYFWFLQTERESQIIMVSKMFALKGGLKESSRMLSLYLSSTEHWEMHGNSRGAFLSTIHSDWAWE